MKKSAHGSNLGTLATRDLHSLWGITISTHMYPIDCSIILKDPRSENFCSGVLDTWFSYFFHIGDTSSSAVIIVLFLFVYMLLFHSAQFTHSVVSDSLWPHGLQGTRPPCPSPTPGLYWNSCPLSRWCHPTISSSVIPFSSHLQSFPASGSFQMSQLFASGGQSIGISASTSVLPMNTQDLSPLGWTGWICLESKGLSRVFSNTTVQKHPFFGTQLSL